jgi:hypothetical protein
VDQSAYPAALRERMGAAAFVSGLLATRARSFAALRQALGALLYCPGRAGGVVPCGSAGLAEGRCSVIALAGTRLHAAELLAKAQAAAGG